MNRLRGKIVLVTGATSGIGRALALQLAGQGARLALCGRSQEKMALLKDELKGAELYASAFSVREPAEISRFVKEAEKALGPIDILINNAGLNSAKGQVDEIRLEDWDEMMEVNARAPMLFAQEIIGGMKERREGMIVNVLSSVCFFHGVGMASYTASKCACQALTGVLRKEGALYGIKVMGVYPGGVDTPFRPQERPEYMTAESVASCIVSALQAPPDVVMHELVMRPMIETNYP